MKNPKKGRHPVSGKINVEIWRPKFFFMSGNTPKVLVDGVQVGKVKNGETLSFTTMPGIHELTLRAFGRFRAARRSTSRKGTC